MNARELQFMARLISLWIVLGLPIVLAALLLSHLNPSTDRHLVLAIAFILDLLIGPAVMIRQEARKSR